MCTHTHTHTHIYTYTYEQLNIGMYKIHILSSVFYVFRSQEVLYNDQTMVFTKPQQQMVFTTQNLSLFPVSAVDTNKKPKVNTFPALKILK